MSHALLAIQNILQDSNIFIGSRETVFFTSFGSKIVTQFSGLRPTSVSYLKLNIGQTASVKVSVSPVVPLEDYIMCIMKNFHSSLSLCPTPYGPHNIYELYEPVHVPRDINFFTLKKMGHPRDRNFYTTRLSLLKFLGIDRHFSDGHFIVIFRHFLSCLGMDRHF